MIKYNPKNWFRYIFLIRKSDTIGIIWKEMIYLAIFTSALVFVKMTYFDDFKNFKQLMDVYSLIGFVLSLLLVFRTNTAYDRWWEGRKKWGEMVNNTRNLAIKISALTTDAEDIKFFSRMIPNYAYAMKEHLRAGVKMEELELTDEEAKLLENKEHIPNQIAKMLYRRFKQMKSNNKITEEEFLVIDSNLKTFSDILGACERIRNTPIPYSYSNFLKKFIFIYVTTVPLAFVDWFGYFSVAVAAFLFYVLVSMEILAEEIEDPFGLDDNDLPTDELCGKIRNNVKEVLL
jgi:putative membrane protein